MGKWIDADALKEWLDEYLSVFKKYDKSEVKGFVEHQPSINIEPKQGEWLVDEGGWKDLDYYPPKCKCNQCGYEEELYIIHAKPTNFCPNCGADMREREGE